MSKVCIVGSSNLINISLISIYTSYFEKNGIEYDLIYWNRKGLVESNNAQNEYMYNKMLNGSNCACIKLFYYLGFLLYVNRLLLRNNYEYVVIWQTSIAYLTFVLLLTKYRNKYFLNIRDYIVEKEIVFKFLIRLLTKYSIINTISSKGFLSFLPLNRKYYLVESINTEIIHNEMALIHTRNSEIIKIGFVGSCRYFDENRKIIDHLANDPRFELWFCGVGSDMFENYARQNNISNVFTMGPFQREQTLRIFSKFDIINSCFGSDNTANSSLIPIRLFTSLSLGIPLMSSKGMFLSNVLVNNNLGIEIDSCDEQLGDYIFSYIDNLDYVEFSNFAHSYLLRAIDNNKEFEKVLDSLF